MGVRVDLLRRGERLRRGQELRQLPAPPSCSIALGGKPSRFSSAARAVLLGSKPCHSRLCTHVRTCSVCPAAQCLFSGCVCSAGVCLACSVFKGVYLLSSRRQCVFDARSSVCVYHVSVGVRCCYMVISL